MLAQPWTSTRLFIHLATEIGTNKRPPGELLCMRERDRLTCPTLQGLRRRQRGLSVLSIPVSVERLVLSMGVVGISNASLGDVLVRLAGEA